MPRRSYTQDAKAVGDIKVGAADTRRDGESRKLDMIMRYIGEQASASFGGDAAKVPCPSKSEWNKLSNGRSAVLPTEGALMLSGSNRRVTKLREHRPNLNILEAWFELGRYDLLTARAAEAAKTTAEEK